MGSFASGLVGGFADATGSKKKSDADKRTHTKPQVKYNASDLSQFKKGGKVKRTGPIYAHKGERVLTKKQQKKLGMKKGGKVPSMRKRGGGKKR